MIKAAGLLDNPRDTLPSDIWDLQKMTMWPQVRSHILRKLASFMPLDIIKEIYIIGSITGYKYKDTSDIDIEVKIDVTHDKLREWEVTADLNNGENAIGTRHPINFHVEKFYKKSTPDSWQDYKFGNYNIMEGTWLKEPPARDSIRDPQSQFRDELLVGQMIARKFLKSTEALRHDLAAYQELEKRTDAPQLPIWISRKQREIAGDIKELIEQAKNIKWKRKANYKWGFGIPRQSFDNIVFKLVEHGQYGELFELLKSVRKDEINESIKGIF